MYALLARAQIFGLVEAQTHESFSSVTGAQQHSDTLAPGSVFERKYRIVQEIGRGGFGMVYLAHQEKMGRDVAIKVLRSGATEMHHSAKQRFLREVKIISRLRHPNTVTIHDFGETQAGVVYMVLEFIEGKTVKSILKKEGAQDPRRALALVTQIARSLAEAHRHGVIHRDLKPANIMVGDLETETDFVKVLDFGIARLARTDQRDLTSVGLPEGERELIGTPRYMSPEQVRGESLTPASDVYSVGLLLYEMLIGHPAVRGDTTLALISQQISPEPLSLDGLRALPEPLANLIRRATAKRLPQRFPDAETFGDAIEQTLASMGGAFPGSASARQTGRFAAVDSSTQFSPREYSGPASGSPKTPGGTYQSGAFHTGNGYEQVNQNSQPQRPSGDALLSEQATNPTNRALGQRQASQQQASQQQRSHQQASQQQRSHQQAGFVSGNFQSANAQSSALESSSTGTESSNNSSLRSQQNYGTGQGHSGTNSDFFVPPSQSQINSNMHSTPNPSSSSRSMDSSRRPQKGQTTSAEFAFAFVRMTVFGVLALVGLYLSFILIAPIFGHFVSGTLKLAATAILSAAIPVLTALGENSKRERFEVIDKPYDRITRVFVGTAIFSFGTGVLCSLVMNASIVHDLRKFPNWFLTDAQQVSKVGELNEKVSLGVALVVEEATTVIGIYSGQPHDTKTVAPRPARHAAPPAPTRPATRAQQRAEEEKKEGAEKASDSPAPKKSKSGAPSKSAPANNANSDYVDW